MIGRRPGAASPDHMDWLQRTTSQMVRCHRIADLLELAYDAIRDGLGYDRVGLLLADWPRRVLVERIGTDEAGHKFYPGREASLDGDTYDALLLSDPRMQPDGPGFIYLSDASRQVPAEARERLDGDPGQTLRVSLRTADQVLGFLSVDNLTSGRPVRETDAPALVAFANALSTAIENASLLEERAQRIDMLDAHLSLRVEQLTWLQEAVARMARPHELDAVLDTVCACVCDGLGYDRIGIFLAEQQPDGALLMLEVRGTDEHGRLVRRSRDEALLHGADKIVPGDPTLAESWADMHHFLQGHDWYYCPDRWTITPPEQRRWLDGPMHEQLAAALRRDGQLVGFLSVDNLISGRPITPEDATPLVTFATQAALAIGRARLWEQHEAQGVGLARRVAELEWLRDVTRRVNAAQTLDEVLDVVYDGVRCGLHYDRVGISLVDHDDGILHEVRGTDATGAKLTPHDRRYPLDHDSPVWLWPPLAALRDGADYHYAADVAAVTPQAMRHIFDGDGDLPLQSLLVALRSGNRLTGTIAVDNLGSGRPITADDAGPLLSLAHQVGTAIENARLRERERAEQARLQVLLDSTRALNSTLDGDQILEALATRLLSALDGSYVSFLVVDLEAGTVSAPIHRASDDRAPLYGPDDVEPLDIYPELAGVLASHAPFVGRLDAESLPPGERAYLERNHLFAELLVPVVTAGHAISILEVCWDRPMAIGADTVALCVAIAEQAAVALENARLYADAADRAERDALTGLLNHRALLATLDHALQRATPASPCAVLLLDVDNFKLFNDTYGHAVGDAVLLRVAAALRAACREGDAAGRYGGDEFALVLRGVSAAEAAVVGQRVRAAVAEQPYVTEGGAVIPLTVSVGVAVAPEEGTRRPELLAVADAAMYAAKRGAPILPRLAEDVLGTSPFGVLEGLVLAVDAKDRYTRVHSDDVTSLALMLADALRLGAEEQRVLALAGPLHDVGKIAVPDRILRKPGSLSDDEYAAIQRHVTYGVALIRGVLDDDAVVQAVAYHHERWDGRGYPYALPGPQTPLAGRVMQVADAVSAMLLDRPYRRGLDWSDVARQLRAGAGTQFDPDLIEPFIAAMDHTHLGVAS